MDVFALPGLTLSLALVAGVFGQWAARHLRLPAIVILLFLGCMLGPDFSDLIRPGTLGNGLSLIVSFAIAIILFEGGLSLRLRPLLREAVSIRNLITWGALLSLAGGTAAALLILGWSFSLSLLFGALIIVTGPTVVTPLIRRLRVKSSVSTILEAEAILIDAVGAIMAVVVLESVLEARMDTPLNAVFGILLRLLCGTAFGIAGGVLAILPFRLPKLFSADLQNIHVLSITVATYFGSHAVVSESGILAVAVAGIVAGNWGGTQLLRLREFKEELTLLLIGVLFVLLAADVRLQTVLDLGLPGILTVLVVMGVVRPVSVFLCTRRSTLTLNEKLFLCWLAPRGIVAAAVSSLFASTLAQHEISGGESLKALVFLMIATTVVVQGLSAGGVAYALNLKRPKNQGYVVLGAHALARLIAAELKRQEVDATLIDSNPFWVRRAEEAGLKVLFGSGLSERTLARLNIEDRIGVIGLSPSTVLNMLFSRKALQRFRAQAAWVSVSTDPETHGADEDVISDLDSAVLFSAPKPIGEWVDAAEGGSLVWISVRASSGPVVVSELWRGEATGAVEPPLPVLILRKSRVHLVDDGAILQKGDILRALIRTSQAEWTQTWAKRGGYQIQFDHLAVANSSDQSP